MRLYIRRVHRSRNRYTPYQTMNCKSIRLFISLGLLFFVACQQECKSIVSTYDNKEAHVILLYPNCNDTSYYQLQKFYNNGQIAYEGFYKNGEKVGHFKSWSESGHQTADWTMLDGKEHGRINCWYDDGTKKRESTLNRGVRNGYIREWHSNGKPASEGTYKNGRQVGMWKTWDQNGTWRVRQYRNDTLWGSTIEHLIDSTGITLVAGQYEAGLEEEIWKWFDKDSILYETCTYNKGKLKGENIEYYKNGHIKSKANLSDGRYNGFIYYFDSTGHPTKKLLYERGNMVVTK
ncbi:hypothetical protein KLP40_15310 [Hymenobacter sp. NST-14]|uniref:toxin-antitoxin system YwqK family antitoxin n=1 Tax=Hymenobacter piscis TaxID=2839984 RepID=UPI001C022BEE|nr:hypothetical protein [Hymenobacter piscis]MBT9394538.1 hypothetical protein [Hymenobacter piscis]